MRRAEREFDELFFAEFESITGPADERTKEAVRQQRQYIRRKLDYVTGYKKALGLAAQAAEGIENSFHGLSRVDAMQAIRKLDE